MQEAHMEYKHSRDEADEYATLSCSEVGIDVSTKASPKVECLEPGVWVVRNVLSEAECSGVIRAAQERVQLAHGPVDTRRYRDMQRATFMCPDASKVVLDRLSTLPLFSEPVVVQSQDASIHQAALEGAAGVWEPHKLNECWRVLKYDPGGHFSPHFDSEHVVAPGLKSLRTFMLYLNDVPSEAGGGTCFVSAGGKQAPRQGGDVNGESSRLEAAPEATTGDPGGAPAETDKVVNQGGGEARLTFDEAKGKFVMSGDCEVRTTVRPEAGMALIFNHNMLHMGEELVRGQKWCLRTDMVYRQVEKHGDEELTENDLQAQELLRQAQRMEEDALWCPAGSEERQSKMAQAVQMYSRVRKKSAKVAAAFGL